MLKIFYLCSRKSHERVYKPTQMLNMANGYENLPLLTAKVAIAQADALFYSPAFNGSAVAREEVGKLLLFCLTDRSCANMNGIKKAFENAILECKYR